MGISEKYASKTKSYPFLFWCKQNAYKQQVHNLTNVHSKIPLSIFSPLDFLLWWAFLWLVICICEALSDANRPPRGGMRWVSLQLHGPLLVWDADSLSSQLFDLWLRAHDSTRVNGINYRRPSDTLEERNSEKSVGRSVWVCAYAYGWACARGLCVQVPLKVWVCMYMGVCECEGICGNACAHAWVCLWQCAPACTQILKHTHVQTLLRV